MTKDTENIVITQRPPVVVVLGHIDHGKTSLLMAIKDFRVLSKESGGITQHVGAYQVEKNEKKITFIDTPGHESFSAIRSRGVKTADIALLVIDAVEGVKPQTKEAIKNINDSGVLPIIVFNKIDKEGANPERVKQELLQDNIWVESLGGKVPSVNVSAKTKQGIDELLEIILLTAEVENFEAVYSGKAEGVVIESKMDSKKGITATLLITQGELKRGDVLGSDSAFGKARILEDFVGKTIEKAYPSDPVVIIGLEKIPAVGEVVSVYDSLDEAKKNLKANRTCARNANIKPDDKVLSIVIKADVIGSLEGINDIINTISQDVVKINILRSEIGEVNESDIKLARNCAGYVFAFKVKTDKVAETIIQNGNIPFYNFDIIYELADKVKELMNAMVVTEKQRIDLGELDVLAIFRTEKEKQIVGGKVIDGVIENNCNLEIYRDNQKIGQGKVVGIEVAKKKVEKANKDSECGLLYKGKEKIQEGDILKFYKEDFIKLDV
jgi:translation initiation factor IF-2